MTTTTTAATTPPAARVSVSSCSCEDYISIGHPCGSSANSNSEEMMMKPILAERYKTKFCRHFIETGVCPYESRCMFAHGEMELRTAEMNMRDGLFTEEAIRAFRQQQWRRTAGLRHSHSHYNYHRSSNNNNNNNNSYYYNDNDIISAYMNGYDYNTPMPLPLSSSDRDAYGYYSYPQMQAYEGSSSSSYYNNNDYNYYNYYYYYYYYYSDPSMYKEGEEVPYVYTHNPYAYDLLSPESRLYSKSPAMPLLPAPQQEQEEEKE
ncbi:Zinc finger protein CTH1, partial [Trypanosoma theileri]